MRPRTQKQPQVKKELSRALDNVDVDVDIEEGDKVYIRDQQRFGEVKGREVNPRSYKVQSETGTTLRRNRRSLIHIRERAGQATDVDANATTSTNVTDPAPPSNPIVTPPSVDKTVRRSSRISRPNQHPEMLYY